MQRFKNAVLRIAAVGGTAVGALSFAQDSGFNPSTISSGVMTYIGGIAAAGVGVLALTVGLSAAWRYAKKFLKG